MNDIATAPPPFYGIGTALLTPFKGDEVDLGAMRRLSARQLEGGVSALIVAGTTGEAPTLTQKERALLLDAVLCEAGGRCPVIMGTGANDTRAAIAHTKEAARLGASGALVVTPYYNKGTPRGIVEHYLAIAESTDLPIILYNVPTRTGVDLTLPLLDELITHPRVVAIKEASGRLDRVADIRARYGDRLHVYSGNDGDLLPTLAFGGRGLISVLSNLLPAECVALYRDFCEGRVQEAAARAVALTPLCRLLFQETNPAPIKCAMADCGLCSDRMRLPMTAVSPALRSALKREVARFL